MRPPLALQKRAKETRETAAEILENLAAPLPEGCWEVEESLLQPQPRQQPLQHYFSRVILNPATSNH